MRKVVCVCCLGQCFSFVDVAWYVEECQRSFCSGSSYSASYGASVTVAATFDVCRIMELYADACFAAGVCVPFREAENCPSVQCNGQSKLFWVIFHCFFY